jgi:hypothetical protein
VTKDSKNNAVDLAIDSSLKSPTIAASPTTRPVKPIEVRRLKLLCASVSDVGNTWMILAPNDTTLETRSAPAWYANIAPQLRICDKITILAEDRCSLYAELLVTDVTRSASDSSLAQH